MEIIQIKPSLYPLVSAFLDIAGPQTLEKFRYFSSRPLEVMKNHVGTFIIRYQQQSIAYAHLDQEEGVTWLGIAIAEGFQGKGLGRLLMAHLVSYARLQGIDTIRLAVDLDNERAIRLYGQFGFVKAKRTTTVLFMELIVRH